MLIIRCKKCRRPFSSYAERCPDCGKRSPGGRQRVLATVASLTVATLALLLGFVLFAKSARSNAAHPSAAAPSATALHLEPVEEPGGAEIKLESP